MDNILASVEAVRQRQQRQWIWNSVSTGLVAGGLLGCLLAFVRFINPDVVSLIWVVAMVIAGPLLGWLWAMIVPCRTSAAASSIDRSCGLKDRMATALDFSGKRKNDVLHQLQIEDANQKASLVDADAVAPIKAPRSWLPGVGLVIAAALLAMLSGPTETANAAPVINSVVASQATRAELALEELKEFNQKSVDPELEEILKELSETIEELKVPGVDPKEALAKLSEMESALERKQEQLQSSSTEQSLREVGEAIALAHPMKSAGEAMANGKMSKASDELKKLEVPELDRKTEKAIQEKLKEVSENKDGAAGKKISEAIKNFAEGLSNGRRSKFREGVEGLAGECNKQGRRKKLRDLLKKQCRCLSDCKCECESECDKASSCNGKGGKNWGLGKSDNEPGDHTSKLKTGPQMQIKGKQSSTGDVDVETMDSAEQKQEAVREYRKQIKKYEQMSESVLSEEAIPLGHRQTIRRYFEMIRPSNGETDAVKDATVVE